MLQMTIVCMIISISFKSIAMFTTSSETKPSIAHAGCFRSKRCKHQYQIWAKKKIKTCRVNYFLYHAGQWIRQWCYSLHYNYLDVFKCVTHPQRGALSVVTSKVQYAFCGHGKTCVLWQTWHPVLMFVQILLKKTPQWLKIPFSFTVLLPLSMYSAYEGFMV